ncbi:MAG: hypothetical protein WCC64_09060 [Aliidongia sp.]
MRIYFDHNLLVNLRCNKFDGLIEKVNSDKKNGHVFVFSPAHLEEIAVSNRRSSASLDIIQRDIGFLTGLCGNNSIRPIKGRIFFDTEYPQECYDRVIENYQDNDEAENIDRDIIYAAHDNPGGDPKIVNNHDPINIFYSNIVYQEILLKKLLDEKIITKSEAIDCLSQWPHKILRDRFSALAATVNLIGNWLEKIGYYRENREKSRSRLHDVSHIIYGRYSDFFVSEDQKLIKKSQAIYKILEIPTKVISICEFIEMEIG